MRIRNIVSTAAALVAAAVLTSATPQWQPSSFSEAIILGLDMITDKVGFISGGAGDAQINVLKTTDGGQTFSYIESDGVGVFQLGLAATSEKAAIVSGVSISDGACMYLTKDGTLFTNSSMPDVFLQQSQDAQVVECGNSTFAAIGRFEFYSTTNIVNGYGVSRDGGATFTDYKNMTELDPHSYPARYGAFPSCNTAFISTGTWPNKNPHPDFFDLSANVQANGEKTRIRRAHHAVSRHHHSHKKATSSSWFGSIARTVDGGETFKNVFQTNQFYFNQIVCPSVKVCYAVGENDEYGFVYGTQDGGDNWSQLLQVAGTSLMAVDAISDEDVFVAGGVMSQPLNGTVFASNNGGRTFSTQYVPGYYLTNIRMTSTTTGVATATDDDSQSDVLYLSSN